MTPYRTFVRDTPRKGNFIMAMSINTNISSMAAQKNLRANESMLTASFNRLSSGLRVNTAADDATGLAVSASMKSQISS